MSYPKVSIIVLNWNGLSDTIECLESLRKITYTNYGVIVVDNGSDGDDARILSEKYADYAHIIVNDKNYGYTGGNNIGMQYSRSHWQPDYHLILNNDTVVAPDFLNGMVETAESDADIGIVGPAIYNYDFPERIIYGGGKLNMWTGKAGHIAPHDESRDVDCVSGCCLLIKDTVAQKVGVLDESYFCYWDDIDYCVRVREAGFRVVYCSPSKIWHKVPAIVPWYRRLKGNNRLSVVPYKVYYGTRNHLKFMRKHASGVQYSSFLIYFFSWHLCLTTSAYLLLYRDSRLLMDFYTGIKDGLLGRTGARY